VDNGKQYGREKSAGVVVQGFRFCSVIESGPAYRGAAVIELPEQGSGVSAVICAEEFDIGFDGAGLRELAEIYKLFEIAYTAEDVTDVSI